MNQDASAAPSAPATGAQRPSRNYRKGA